MILDYIYIYLYIYIHPHILSIYWLDLPVYLHSTLLIYFKKWGFVCVCVCVCVYIYFFVLFFKLKSVLSTLVLLTALTHHTNLVFYIFLAFLKTVINLSICLIIIFMSKEEHSLANLLYYRNWDYLYTQSRTWFQCSLSTGWFCIPYI